MGKLKDTAHSLQVTILYGALFTAVQWYEYAVAPFSINNGIFGSLFYVLTGFHGTHGMYICFDSLFFITALLIF